MDFSFKSKTIEKQRQQQKNWFFVMITNTETNNINRENEKLRIIN